MSDLFEITTGKDLSLIIIGYPCQSLSDSLLFSRLDCWTLACEDANSKLVEVVTVADVDAEKRVSDSLVQI